MGKIRLAMLSTVLSALVLTKPAAAENTDADGKVARLRQQNPEVGLLFFDIAIFGEGKPRGCIELRAFLVGADGRTRNVSVHFITGLLSYSLSGTTYGALATLPPGAWSLGAIKCDNETFRGEFARGRIQPGETINGGSLVVDYKYSPFSLIAKRTFSSRTRVEDLRPEAVESIRKRAPVTFAKAIKRYMVPNPAMK